MIPPKIHYYIFDVYIYIYIEFHHYVYIFIHGCNLNPLKKKLFMILPYVCGN